MRIRKAVAADLAAIAQIYDDIHTAEEQGRQVIGWVRGVYPTARVAELALQRNDLFVMEADGRVVATAIINRQQVDSYAAGQWQFKAPDIDIMVLHTLIVDPAQTGRGYGKAFVAFYEAYALQNGCHTLRMDTQVINAAARALYKKLGYREADVIPCAFNGIQNVQLVLLEKQL